MRYNSITLLWLLPTESFTVTLTWCFCDAVLAETNELKAYNKDELNIFSNLHPSK